jgi:hypothetical protein
LAGAAFFAAAFLGAAFFVAVAISVLLDQVENTTGGQAE